MSRLRQNISRLSGRWLPRLVPMLLIGRAWFDLLVETLMRGTGAG
jgi:hypothetical protein